MNKIEIVYYNLWKRETFSHMVDDYRRFGNRYIEAVSIEENNKFFLECYQDYYNKRGYKFCDNWLRGLLASYVKRRSLENGDTPYYKRYYKEWIDNTKWISGDFPELQKWCDEYMNYLDSIDTNAEATTQTIDNEQIISTMKRTSYNIELLKQIWENLSPDQRMECLRQADRGDCSTPLGLNVDVWKAATHYMDQVGLAKAAHIEGGECEAIRLTVSGKAMLTQLESNTKWIDISNLGTKASHYVDLVENSKHYIIPTERTDIKETVNGLHDAISRIDVNSLPTALSGFNTNQTKIITEMTIVVSVINGLTALLGDNLPNIKKFDPRAAEAFKFCKTVNPIMQQVLQTLEKRRQTDPTFDDDEAMERFNCFLAGDYDDMSIDEFVPRYIINDLFPFEAIRRLNYIISQCTDIKIKERLMVYLEKYRAEKPTSPQRNPDTTNAEAATPATSPEPIVNTEELSNCFNAKFKGVGGNPNYFDMMINDIKRLQTSKDLAMVALMIYNCNSYFIKRPRAFAAWLRTFFELIGRDCPKETSPNKYKPSDTIKRIFYYLV